MSRSRLELQDLLEETIGSTEVYFQKPVNTKMVYPAIVYDLVGLNKKHADNLGYHTNKRYTITYITDDPDDPIIFRISGLPMCSFDRGFVLKGLRHYTYNIYF